MCAHTLEHDHTYSADKCDVSGKFDLKAGACISQNEVLQNCITCILALPHWEMACCAESAPSEMKLRGKPQP